jgi:hypothetical protein
MKIKPGFEEEFEVAKTLIHKHTDAIIKYVNDWSLAMENCIAEGQSLKDIAIPLSEQISIIDSRPDHVKVMAAILLMNCWIYGDELTEIFHPSHLNFELELLKQLKFANY